MQLISSVPANFLSGSCHADIRPKSGGIQMLSGSKFFEGGVPIFQNPFIPIKNVCSDVFSANFLDKAWQWAVKD